MDLDDLDIYEDLDTFQQDEEKKTAELLSLEAKYNDSLKTIETLQLENADLKKQIRRIGINFQNLLDTAKAEIRRKDKQIEQLRKEKDDICFRRKQPRREYTDVPSTSQHTNTWFKNKTVLPTANTNENVEAIDNEHQSATSYNSRGREITHITDDYKKQERRNESLERKYDSDPQREKYDRSNKQREQHVSRYNVRSTERDGSVRNATRDYSQSHDSRTVERGHNIKNKTFKSETEKESYNITDNDRRQHSYDRLGGRSRYHGKEEKPKYESYDSRHDKRSDSKEARTKSESSDFRHDRRSDSKEARIKSESSDTRHDRRSDSKRHNEDANKKSKETNEKARDKVMNININENVTYTKNSDGLTQSKDIHGRTPNSTKDGRREDKLSENPKFSERTHEDTKKIETVKGGDFLDKHLPASKDSQSLKKLLAEEKLTKEKLIALENEFSCKETDKNANRLLSADGMTTPKKTALFDELFGNTPTNPGNVNSNVIDFRKDSSSSATTSPSNYTDTSEPTTISSTINSRKTDTNEYYIPIKGEQNKQNTNDVSLVANNFNVGLVGEKLISSLTSKNQAANENSAKESVTCVKTTEETVDYAKIATILLSEDDEETEIEQAAETTEDATLKNEAKTNGTKINGGIQILSNIRLPNIYEIRAHQRRLRELAAAKKAKRAKLAETNIKPNAAQNITKVVVPVSELVTKGIQKNSTTTTTAAENNEGVDLEEESIEAKIQQDKNTHKNSPQLSPGISADTNVITPNNETTTEVSSSDATKIVDHQGIENLKLVNKNVTPPLEANTEATPNDKSVAEEPIRSNNTEKCEQVINGTEGINEIATAKTTDKLEQIATANTILNNAISDALDTVQLIVEKAVIQNETKSTQIAIKTVITSAVSPTTNINNEKNESGDLSLSSTTVTNTTPNNDMPVMDLLTNLLPDDSERKKEMVEAIENIKKSQELEESKDRFSHTVQKKSAQLKACGANTNHLLQNGPMNIEDKESCKQNVIAQQKEITEVKEIYEQKVGITDEENMQATEKLLEAVNTANETTIEVKVASENAESNCDSVSSKEKTVVDDSALRETEAALSYLVDNMDKPTNSFIENEQIKEVQNVPNIETKSAAESEVVEKQHKAADNHRNKNPKSKAKEFPNTANNSPERNILIENMKRSEILWKFKIPKISAKRRREESVDGSSAKEIKNAGTDVVKKEKLCIKKEEPIIPYKKKKNDKLIPKQMQQETKMIEINVNIEKNLLETKTLFENQKKSERIIKEIDNWARRKVGETTEILETENQIEHTQAHKISSTNKHETVKKTHSKDEIHTIQKTDEHKAHIDKNSESTTNDAKSVTAKQRDHNKTPTEERSTRERSSEKRDQTELLKGQNTKIQERRKSQPNIEHDEHSQDSKSRNGKHDVEIHKEKNQNSEDMAAKCGQRLVTKVQRADLKTLNVEISEKANNTVKKALGSHELVEKSKNSSDNNFQSENADKKALESLKFSTKEHITPNSCEINNVKYDISKESADDLNQKKLCDKNHLVAKKKSTEKELSEEDADNHVKRAKSDIGGGKKENVQKLSEKEVTTTEEMQVASDSHTEITNDNQRIATAFNQTPKRRKTSASSDDSEVMSNSQRRKRFKMRIEDSDDVEEFATHSPPTAVPEPTEALVDVERKNKDIIDILQNDRANESNDNLPAPQTPTSLPMNVSQDAKYEEIDSRMQLMFASPKIADKTSSSNSLAVANQLKTQVLQSSWKDSAVVAAVTDTVSSKIADETSPTDQLVFENPIKQSILEDRAVAMGPTSSKSPNKALSEHPAVANPIKSQLMQPNTAVVMDVTATETPIHIDLPTTVRSAFDVKPPADFNVTDSFLSDISANSFLATDMNVTIEETNHTNTSLSDSSLSTKHISLGSSDYRFEKVSENVVNLFITRKRRGKRKPTATITTNTIPAT